MSKNVGKIFESDFIDSVKKVPYCWHKRLNDNASSWADGRNTRFTSTNECDFLLYDCNTRTLSCVELKSTSSSLTYWREDFETTGQKSSFNIKKNQILGLSKFNKFNINCGFIFNFRNKDNTTYYVTIDDFLKYTSTIQKKSINISDIEQMNPILINSNIKRTRYSYDIEEFLEKIKI